MDGVAAQAGGHDVFLSYRSADRDTVERIAERLVSDARLRPWFDRWSQTAGRSWQEEAGQAMEAVNAVAVFVGSDALGAWEREEMFLALDRAAKKPHYRVFAVLLPGAPDPFDPNVLPHFLRTRTWVDLRSGPASTRAFRDLVNAVRGLPFGPSSPPTPRREVCPYRGLQVFDEQHADFFFGREADVQRLLEELKDTAFLAVLGPSGSGKSSLVRAGLLPALRRSASSGETSRPALVFRPGAQPLAELAVAMLKVAPDRAVQPTLDRLAADRRTLDHVARLALADRSHSARLVLCVDQFEEAFALCPDEQERRAFFANLVEAGSSVGGRAVIVIALRADFYPRLAPYRELAQLVSGHQFLVGQLDSEGLREAIERPARRVGLTLEPGLTETILRDVGGEPGRLPLLEHALLELWNRRHDDYLTLDDYRDAGGVDGALTKAAEQLYAGFDYEERALARRLLLRLTQASEGAENTRRRAARGELVPKSGDLAAFNRVLDALIAARLVTISRNEDVEEIEVAHEALIRAWSRLRTWTEEDREGLRLHSRLTAAANEWAKDLDADRLYAGLRLASAEEWAKGHESELNANEQKFLQASRSRERRRRFFRVYANFLLIAVVAMASLAVIALREKGAADDQRRIARSRELAASAIEELTRAPAHSVQLASRALDAAGTREAQAALRAALSETYERHRVQGHRGSVSVPVDGSAFAPDGRQAVTMSSDGTAALWDTANGKLLHRLRGHDGPVTAAAFSPDGTLVVTAGKDRTARIWDSSSGTPVSVLRGHSAWITGASFSRDNRMVVTAGGYDRTARVWSVSTGRLIRRLPHSRPVASAVFDPGGRDVLTASWDGTVRLWQVRTGRLLWDRPGGGIQQTSAAFSRDGRRIVATSAEGVIRVWDMRTGSTRTMHARDTVESASFSHDGRYVVSRSGTIAQVWNAARGTHVDLEGHSDFVNSAVFSPDDTAVVTASNDGTARVWDAITGRTIRGLRGHADTVTSAVFTRNGKHVITGSEDRTVRIWDTDLGTALRGHAGWVLGTAFDRSGRRVATASRDGRVRVWAASTGELIDSVESGPNPDPKVWEVNSVAFTKDGRQLVTASASGETSQWLAQIWDMHARKLRRTLAVGGSGWATSAAVSPNGRELAVATGRVAEVWDTRTRTVTRRLPGHDELVTDVSFSPDGRSIVTASTDGSARVWAGKRIVVLRHPHGDVHSAAFAPSGRFVVTGSSDRTARIWAIPSGHLVHELRGHESAVYDAVFSRDGRQVITGGDDGSTRFWDARSGTLLATLRMHSESVNAVAVGPDMRVASASDDRTARIYRCRTCGSIVKLRTLAGELLARTAGSPAGS